MLTDVTKSDVLAVAPELSLSDAYWADLMLYVNAFDFTSLDTVQTVRMARIFLAAHMGTLTKRAGNGTAGPVTDEMAGGVRRSYAVALTRTELGATGYGATLWSILTSSGAHGPVLA